MLCVSLVKEPQTWHRRGSHSKHFSLIQDQVGWGFEQLGLVEGVPAHGKGVRTRWSLEVPSNPNHSMILWSSATYLLLWLLHEVYSPTFRYSWAPWDRKIVFSDAEFLWAETIRRKDLGSIPTEEVEAWSLYPLWDRREATGDACFSRNTEPAALLPTFSSASS